MNAIAISNFFKAIDPYKKDNAIQIKLWKFGFFSCQKIICPFSLLKLFSWSI
jgi:hypothetical protein